ncbi:MAG: S8 family serine peptidase [Microbacterium sp.]
MQRRILAVIGATLLTLPASAALAATPDDDPGARFSASSSRGAIDSSYTAGAIGPDGHVTVVIEMEGDPVAVVEAESGRELSEGERDDVKSTLTDAQSEVVETVESTGGEVQAQMASAYNGVQASVPADQLDAVAELPGVVAVHPVRRYSIDNAVSVPFLGVPEVWQNTGYTGQNIKVGIIDTGIDYTHATFGGPGTPEAYEAAHAAADQPADPALYGPDAPRVKGGVDLVGDDYNADPSSASYQPVPHPDDNPLDCQGHGSHVAGTAAGSGVLADGAGYTGPYDASTPSNTFRVGPGVAPQADLYAIRVFGCDGSTDVVVPALDWAVDNGMDVVNLSLGSSFGRGDDPDAVAAANAVGAGVVVVASAGNAGHSPYLTGAPGSGDGVIAVSAVDSAEGFPGATVTVDGQAVEAINANGASLDGLGDLTVVRLVDDPATPENEAIGCSVEAYTKAGVTADGNQLAVSERGSCARVAKAIYAQQAGAAAALMVNSTDDLPPYEGQITENADTGEPYLVTIPFLGVRSSNGSLFTTGATVSLAAAQIANPGFRAYASFTSSGPRSGDSAVSPDVAAPGVSISSAAVGSGNGAAVLSGTSMAAPHVAGVAALSAQAHPEWSAPQLAASVVSTADPDKVVGESITIGGLGLVDAAQAVATTVTAAGDAFRTESGWAREAALSFGFQGVAARLRRHQDRDGPQRRAASVTYDVDDAVGAVAEGAGVPLRVVDHGRAGQLGEDPPDGGCRGEGRAELRRQGRPVRVLRDLRRYHADVGGLDPAVLVPRSSSTVSSATPALFTKKQKVADATKKISLWNLFGAQPSAGADVYTWGLSDEKDAAASLADTGYDLRAAGVQSFGSGDDALAVFAVNMHKRWSNAASNEYDVLIDSDRDGSADWIVLSADSGAVRAGDTNGIAEVFIVDAKTGALGASGFLTQAPTDSSTMLLPVYLADLGITGAFDYTVQTYGVNGGTDAASGWATYDPSAPAITNGQYVDVAQHRTASVEVKVNAAQVEVQKPFGSMVVVMDNPSGASEALLVKLK